MPTSSRPSTKYNTRIILEPIYEVRPRKDRLSLLERLGSRLFFRGRVEQ
jgi:hypothetical protein